MYFHYYLFMGSAFHQYEKETYYPWETLDWVPATDMNKEAR